MIDVSCKSYEHSFIFQLSIPELTAAQQILNAESLSHKVGDQTIKVDSQTYKVETRRGFMSQVKHAKLEVTLTVSEKSETR